MLTSELPIVPQVVPAGHKNNPHELDFVEHKNNLTDSWQTWVSKAVCAVRRPDYSQTGSCPKHSFSWDLALHNPWVEKNSNSQTAIL